MDGDDDLQAIKDTARRYRRTEKAHDEARAAAVAAVLAALRNGKRPTDVIEACPFTGAYVRRIARENGIKPRVKGKRPES